MDGVSPSCLDHRCQDIQPKRHWPALLIVLIGGLLSGPFGIRVAIAQPGRGYDAWDRPGQPSSPSSQRAKPVRTPPPFDVADDNPLAQPLVDVRVEGNPTIPAYVILQQITTRPGRPASQPQIAEDVRSLYDTRWFTSVAPVYQQTDEGLALVFRVVEKPIVRKVEFVGNKKIKTKKLVAETGLQPGAPFDVTINKEAVQRVRQLYIEKGYRHVKVDLQQGADPQDRDVVIAVTEGPKVQVRAVFINGNKAVSEAVLKLDKSTKSRFWFLPWFGGQYDPETVPNDEIALTQYYQGLGYFDVAIESKSYWANKKKSLVDVHFNVQEGPRFKVRHVNIVGEQVVGERTLREPLKLVKGQFFNARHLSSDISTMKANYDDLGRLFAQVNAQPVFLEEAGYIDLVYNIDEDKPYYIGDINVAIRGDHPHTSEDVVRNQVDAYIQPGRLANAANIRKMQSRLLGSHLWERTDPPSVNIRKVVGSDYVAIDIVGRAQSSSLVDAPLNQSRLSTLPAFRTLEQFGHSVKTRTTTQRMANDSTTIDSSLRPDLTSPKPTIAAKKIPAADIRYQRSESQTVVSFKPINFGHSTASGKDNASGDDRASEKDGDLSATWDKFIRTLPSKKPARPPVVQAPNRGISVSGVSPANEGRRSDPDVSMNLTEHRGPSDSPLSGLTPTARQKTPNTRSDDSLWSVSNPELIIRGQSPAPFYQRPPAYRGQSMDSFGNPVPQDYLQGVSPQGDPFGNANRGPIQPGFVDVDVDVTEARTGRLMFGVGVNSDAGVVGSIVLEENNFDIMRPPRSFADILNGQAWRGGGQSFRIEAVPGSEVSRYLVSWQDPFFMNTDFSLGTSGFYYTRFFRNWDEERLGGRVTLGRLLGNFWSVSGAVRLENVNMKDIRAGAPAILTDVRGDNFLSTGRVALSHDTRDSSFLPTQGHMVELSYEQAFGDFSYGRYEVTGSQFFTLWERPDGRGKHILQLRGQVGYTGDDTPIFERFYAGGFQSFRGFEFRGVTPRQAGVRTGGQFMALGTAEYIIPISAGDNVRGVVFSDFGTVEETAGFDDLRVSVGAGLRLIIPAMGPAPIALDFAYPLTQQDFDERQIFSFYVGFTR